MTSLATTTRELLTRTMKPSANMWMTSSPGKYQCNRASRHKNPVWQLNYGTCAVRSDGYAAVQRSQEKNTTGQQTNPTRKHTKALNEAGIDYINGILKTGLDECNPQPFWCYIFSQRNDHGGVAVLRKDGKLHTGGQKMAEILNKQFTSIFSVDKPGNDTVLSRPSYPPIDRLLISVQGVKAW